MKPSPTEAGRHRVNTSAAPGRVRAAGMIVGLLVSAGLVWQSSQAAFTATTSNGPNAWQAGKVTLTTDLAGTALFTTASYGAMKPGAQTPQCIEVQYGGDITAEVRLRSTGLVETAGVADDAQDIADLLTLKVEIAPDGTSCASLTGWTELTPVGASPSIKTVSTTYTTFANGLKADAWKPTGAQDMVYRFTPTLADDNRAQGDKAEITFVWEAQSL